MDLEREQQLLRRRLLGVGLACYEIFPGLDVGRDLSLVRGPTGLDFAQVEGLDNLGQALALALTTALGADLFNVQYGFDGLNALVDATNSVLQRERIRVGIIQVLRKDARVRQILDVQMDGGPLTPLRAPGSRVLNVRVEFQAVTADASSAEVTTGLGAV